MIRRGFGSRFSRKMDSGGVDGTSGIAKLLSERASRSRAGWRIDHRVVVVVRRMIQSLEILSQAVLSSATVVAKQFERRLYSPGRSVCSGDRRCHAPPAVEDLRWTNDGSPCGSC